MRKINSALIYFQTIGDKIHPVSFELIAKARKLVGGAVDGIIIDANPKKYYRFCEDIGLRRVFGFRNALFEDFILHLYEQPFVECIIKMKPSIVLVGSTLEGRALAPRVAAKCKTGLTADCTGLSLNEDGFLIQTRPAFGGDKLVKIITPEALPQMSTVRPGIFKQPAEKVFRYTEFVTVEFQLNHTNDVVCIDSTSIKSSGNEIENAKKIIAVGRGVENHDDFQKISRFAEKSGSYLGYSRGIVERGWADNSGQIGFSGHAVAPDILVTLGISGSVQFLAGISNAKSIISVNTDENAPIFRKSTLSIVSDVHFVIDELDSLLE